MDYVLIGMFDTDSEACWGPAASSYGASSWGGRSEVEPHQEEDSRAGGGAPASVGERVNEAPSVLRRVPPPSRGPPENLLGGGLLGLDGTEPR